MSTEPRTITVRTLDHGTLTVPEPTWCTGHAPYVGYRDDFTHYGPEQQLHFHGHLLWTAMLAHAPFSASPRVGVYVEQTGFAGTLDAAGLRELAAVQDVHAEQLRRLARELEAQQDGGDR
ncbi:hypothetical protein SHJG_5503 [Streptomyces hygroscopicus subsp. jinggangensis 5008]|nr:hypothetical protein SHJG_5503 [Streptomyces hygroscopicus subsp. jinggangensis 5008]AGF64929.1 hypothetical protein SHJGH_5266 [Streptomyces hygroscopicus subsp. jinggangensis TL01]